MTKFKIFFSCIVFCSLFMVSCQKDVKDDVDTLKKTTIVDVKFEGTQMVVTYSDGETKTVDLPSSVTQSVVKSTDYDEETGVLTITFTDGSTSTYQIISHDEELVLAQDVNGKYNLQEIKMGDVSLADFTYDTQKRLTQIAVRFLLNDEVTNIAKVVNTYTGSTNTGYTLYTYATDQSVSYGSNYLGSGSSAYVSFDHQLTTEETIVDNGDGTYTYYSYNYSSGSTYYYYRYDHCVYVSEDSIYDCRNNDQNYYYKKISSNEFYRVPTWSSMWNYKTVDDVTMVLMQADYIYTITGIVNKGDIKDTITVKVEYNSAGLADKMYQWTYGSDDTPNVYIQNTYDANNLLIENDLYYKDGDEWVMDSSNYITHTYNSNKQLVSSTLHYKKDGKPATRLIYEVTYDDQNNPTTIAVYQDEKVEWQFVEGTDGNYTYEPVVTKAAGLQDMVKIEYNYYMKNFWGNTWESIIPELKGIKLNNAPTKILYAGHFSYANMEYSNFNDGGYPQTVTMTVKPFDLDISLKSSMSGVIGLVDFSAELTLNYVKTSD